MVPVHVQVTAALDREVDQSMPGERLEHVVEESDPAVYPRLAGAVEDEANVEVRLFGLSPDFADPVHEKSVNGER
jgi:hypothetical protein